MVGQALNLKVEGSKLWGMEASPSYHIRALREAFHVQYTLSIPLVMPKMYGFSALSAFY